MNAADPGNRKARRAGRKRGGGGAGPGRERLEALIGRYRAGRYDEALAAARELTRRWPREPVGWNVVAASLEGLGRPGEAVEAYRRALELEPGNAGASNNLGNALRALGCAEEAVAAYRGAVRSQPGFAEAHHNLGLALAEAGRPAEAATAYRAALDVNPGLVATWANLGNALRAAGDPEGAESAYRSGLERDPGHARLWSNLGDLYADAERAGEAVAAYDRALAAEPDNAHVHSNRGLLAIRLYDLEQAEASCRRALALAPDDPGALTNLACALKELGRFDEAEACYRRVVELEPGDAAGHENLANVLADRGRNEEAARTYRRALELRPDDAGLWYRLALTKSFQPDDPDLRSLEAALDAAEGDPGTRAYLLYALAKAYADIGEPDDRVFSMYAAAARARRATLDYDVAADEARMAAIARAFPPERLAAAVRGAHPADAPVFIVGMPRSGTTLVEQILGAHSKVHAAGEQLKLPALVRGAGAERAAEFPDWVAAATGERLGKLAADYCRSMVEGLPRGTERVTDKLPANFQYLGLIALALPNARVVHLRRNPVDTCVSCFTHLFAQGQEFSYDLAELGRYYRAYDALMAHWRRALPDGLMLELDYEDVVAAPERETRRLLDHCGLEWERGCLEFHRLDRGVRTASSEQVRQPLYRHAVGRWRRYRDHLGPLLEALGPLAPEDA